MDSNQCLASAITYQDDDGERQRNAACLEIFCMPSVIWAQMIEAASTVDPSTPMPPRITMPRGGEIASK
jgi:hypothetical protein